MQPATSFRDTKIHRAAVNHHHPSEQDVHGVYGDVILAVLVDE